MVRRRVNLVAALISNSVTQPDVRARQIARGHRRIAQRQSDIFSRCTRRPVSYLMPSTPFVCSRSLALCAG